MATPKIIADFETQLSTAVAVGATSFSLASATDDDGVALPTGLYYFTVDNGSTSKEYLAGTLTGTSVASVVSVSVQGAETSGAAKAHRIGASVMITDFATYKKYMDEIAVAGAADADTSTKGVLEAATLAEVRAGTATGSTGAALAVTPDVLDDLPTEDEKGALAGSGNAPDATNTFVTTDDLSDPTFKPPQVLTYLNAASPATWTKDAGLKYVVVEVQAGGGAGGQGDSDDNGGSGGSGGYSRKLILASALGATETVTIGTIAGNSSFGAHATTVGGGSASGATAGTAGTAASGDINIPGQAGQAGLSNDSSGSASEYRAPGETASVFGVGGYGSGGRGERQTAGDNGPGVAGIVIVTEYYS